jgi:thioredoxin-related protein
MKSILLLGLTFCFSLQAATSAFFTNADRAFKEAKRKKAPVLISFYGIWCPPCNQLEETVFESTNFLEKAKSFVLLKLDADAKESWKWKDKYKVGGYPTVVFTTAKGEELYRVVGYRSPAEFLRIMSLVADAKDKDLSTACKSQKEDDLWRCAVICQERKDKPCAEAAYAKLEKTLKPGSPRYLEARTFAVESSATEDLKRTGYEALMAQYPGSPKAAFWAYSYTEMFEEGGKLEPKKEILQKVVDNVDGMMTHADRDELGVTKTDLLQIKAMVLAKLGKREEAIAAWAAAAKEFTALAAQLPKGSHARGFTIERISCLEEAGDLEGALALANEYRKIFPEEFTFHYQAAGLLNRAKRMAEAIPLAKKAYDASYGDNRIRAATLLVKLYASVPDKKEAQVVYNAVKKEIHPDAKLEIRTHRYLQALDKAMLAFGEATSKGR